MFYIENICTQSSKMRFTYQHRSIGQLRMYRSVRIIPILGKLHEISHAIALIILRANLHLSRVHIYLKKMRQLHSHCLLTAIITYFVK